MPARIGTMLATRTLNRLASLATLPCRLAPCYPDITCRDLTLGLLNCRADSCKLFYIPDVIYTYIFTIFVRMKHTIMNTKLTIKLDDDVITRAKTYAKKRKTSLSKMIESYLDSVTKPDSKKVKITPLVKSLSGVISLPLDYDYKKDRTDYLTKKYL
jgi:hypothetical protein